MLAADNDKHQLLYTLLENSAYNAIEQIHHKSFNQYHKSKLLKSTISPYPKIKTNQVIRCERLPDGLRLRR